MLYDDFQNENSHYTCKGSVFRQNDIIIFRQNDKKDRREKAHIFLRQKAKKTRYYVFDRMTSKQIAFSFFSLMIWGISELMNKQAT